MTSSIALIAAADIDVESAFFSATAAIDPDLFSTTVVTTAARTRDSLRAAVATTLAPQDVRRVIVVAGHDHPDAFLGGVLARIMIAEQLDVEVAYVAPVATAGTRTWGLPHGRDAAVSALTGSARAVPLIRDDTAAVIIGTATHRGANGPFTGETYADSVRLFSGSAREVAIRPTRHEPGVEGAVTRKFRQRWTAGRAVQTGGVDVVVARDGVVGPRPVPRSTIYRHNVDWNLVYPA